MCQLVEILDFRLYHGYMLTRRGHESLSFAHVFKHCGFKMSILSVEIQSVVKKTHFAVPVR